MNRTLASTSILLALLPVGCSDSTDADIPEIKSDLSRDRAPAVPPAELGQLVAGNSQLATDLYRLAAKKQALDRLVASRAGQSRK